MAEKTPNTAPNANPNTAPSADPKPDNATATSGNAGSKAPPVDVSPDLLVTWLAQGDATLVDVREDYEHAEERIEGAIFAPLSKFDPNAVRDRAGDSRVVFHCRSGRRSIDAAQQYANGGEKTFHLAGGIEAWKASGQPTLRSASGPKIPIMRQVQMTAGSLVAIGVALGAFVSPWLLVIPAFVGVGLIFAGASGWCGMAKLLAKAPWNRVPAGSTPQTA